MGKAKSSRAILLAGVLVSFMAAAFVFWLAGQATPAAQLETRPLVVSTADIPVSTILDDTNIPILTKVVKTTVEAFPAGGLGAQTEIPKGTVVTAPISKGTPLTKDALTKVITPTNNNGLSTNTNLKPGFVAYTITVSDNGSIAGGIQTNDHVDLVISYKPPVTATVDPSGKVVPGLTKNYTKIILQNVQVLNVGTNFVPDPRKAGAAPAPAGSTSTITFPLAREDALLLKFLKDDGANIDLLLRPIGDDKVFDTTLLTPDGALNRLGGR